MIFKYSDCRQMEAYGISELHLHHKRIDAYAGQCIVVEHLEQMIDQLKNTIQRIRCLSNLGEMRIHFWQRVHRSEHT